MPTEERIQRRSEACENELATAGYGLRRGALSPLETLAQSISTIAPSTSPALTIPLVYALAGPATWFAYTLAGVAMILVALCVSVFARETSSPGSLYAYTRQTLPPVFSAMGALALLFAYVMTGASVLGGFVSYSYEILGALGHHISPVLLTTVSAGVAIFIAYRDVRISAQLMLWIETVSVLLIAMVIGLTLYQHGPHADWAQLRLHRSSLPQVRLGVVLAIFSFVGFESATSLGAEARDPLRSIPRAVVTSALLAGMFFTVCAYGEVLGFAAAGQDLGLNTTPMHLLASSLHVRLLGTLIDLGVLISMFAATLACVISSARLLMLMARDGLTPPQLGRIHVLNQTPGLAGLATGLLSTLPVAILMHLGISGADVYGWMGALAVFGFLTAYLLLVLALPVYLHRRGRLSVRSILLAVAAAGAMLLVTIGTIFPLPPAPYRYFPYIYLAYLSAGLAWCAISIRGRRRRENH